MSHRAVILGLLGLSAAAFYWPHGVFNPFEASAPWLGVLIAVTMFAVGCLLPVDEIRQIGRQWPLVVAGTALQYSAMPFLAFAIGRLFQFEPGIMAGVILVGCVPGAMASNVLTLLARGNTTYSVCLTTAATLLSPVAVPLALSLTLGADHSLDFWKTSLQLMWQVVLPVGIGFGVCQLSSHIGRWAEACGPVFANITILWIIASVVGVNRDRLDEMTGSIFLALLLINGLGYAAGYVGGVLLRMDEPMRRALTLEIGMQNCGLGTTMALAMFPGTGAAIPTAIYTFGCMLTGTMLATYWARRPVPETPSPVAVDNPLAAQEGTA